MVLTRKELAESMGACGMCLIQILSEDKTVGEFLLTKPDDQSVSDNEFHNFVHDVRAVMSDQYPRVQVLRRDKDQQIIVKISSGGQKEIVSAVIQAIWTTRLQVDRRPFAERSIVIG